MTVRRERRCAKRYAVTVTVRCPCGNQQKISVDSYPRELSLLCRWKIIPTYQDAEDDMHLFDIPMQPPPSLDSSHEFSKFRGDLVQFTLERFLSGVRDNETVYKEYPQRNMDSHQGTHEGYTNSSKSSIFPKHHFACPFYARNPKQHMACLTRANLRDIKDVKQHLWSAHRLPPYCPSCGEVFTTSQTCGEHIRNRSCGTRELPLPEGITVQQMQQLARRAESWMPKELQWLSLWAIVFPREDLPAVQYPSNATESMVCSFRDYWSSFGEKIISDFLQEKELRDHELRDEERSLTALHFTVLHEVTDHLVESFEREDYNTVFENTEQGSASVHHS